MSFAANAAACDPRYVFELAIEARLTPAGPTVTKLRRGGAATLEDARSRFSTEVIQAGALVTGPSWECYLDGDVTGPGGTTQLYLQLLEQQASLIERLRLV